MLPLPPKSGCPALVAPGPSGSAKKPAHALPADCLKLERTLSEGGQPCTRLARVGPLLATKSMAWRTACGVVQERNAPYLDAPLEPQMHEPNRWW
jgi:hypothetical protein